MSRLNLASAEGSDIVNGMRGIFTPLRIVGLATAALGVLTLGLFVGQELRVRYKFRRRTPSDFFSNAGDPIANAEYGMGI